jgi:hypothetical protein
MHIAHPIRLAILSIGILLAGCTATSAPPAASNQRTETGSNLATCTIPVLRSSYHEKQWGAPQITTYSDGGYRLMYRQGSSLNYVFVHGITNPAPVPTGPPDCMEEKFNESTGEPAMVPHPQSWRNASILGTSVKWYQKDMGGGADFPFYKTVDFPLTAGDGRAGHYRVEVCSSSESKAADWIKRVNW